MVRRYWPTVFKLTAIISLLEICVGIGKALASDLPIDPGASEKIWQVGLVYLPISPYDLS